MKLSRMAVAAAALCGLYAGHVAAHEPVVTQPVAVNYDSYYYQPEVQTSPSDQPQMAPVQPGMGYAPCQSHVACQPQCDCADDCCEEAVCEPWRLFCQKECGWNIYGFIDAGITGNREATPSRFNGVTTFNDRREGMMNQLYMIVENTVDTESCCWDIGGRVDTLYGTDYIFTQAIGLELHDDGSQHWNSGQQFYGIALPQAYLEIGGMDLSLKLGHFYTPAGYEVVPANGNFFYSHAYTMQYGEPFTHSGALATYTYSDTTKLIGGFVNGWDALDRREVGGPLGPDDAGAFIAGLIWSDDVLTLSYNFIYSEQEPTVIATTTERYLSSLVVTWNINCDWQYVFQNDIGIQENASPGTGFTSDAEWYGINQYLFYTLNDCWKFGTRFEWFRDDDGVRVGAVRPSNDSVPTSGFAGDFFEITGGLNWTPHANLIVRPEVRYDWYEGPRSGVDFPFNDGDDKNQFLGALDVILLW